MWLFEVHDGPRPGFRLNLRHGYAGVCMGQEGTCESWLPLGNSIERALSHPDDQQLQFQLLRAKLEDTTSGLCLVKQTEDEARAERKALVLVDGCTDREIGVTNIAEAYGRSMPELVTYVESGGCVRRLYVFKPGDALFISWPARALNAHKPKRFVIAWDGEKLEETAVGRPRRNSRPPKKVREQERKQNRSAGPPELRPS